MSKSRIIVHHYSNTLLTYHIVYFFFFFIKENVAQKNYKEILQVNKHQDAYYKFMKRYVNSYSIGKAKIKIYKDKEINSNALKQK